MDTYPLLQTYQPFISLSSLLLIIRFEFANPKNKNKKDIKR